MAHKRIHSSQAVAFSGFFLGIIIFLAIAFIVASIPSSVDGQSVVKLGVEKVLLGIPLFPLFWALEFLNIALPQQILQIVGAVFFGLYGGLLNLVTVRWVPFHLKNRPE